MMPSGTAIADAMSTMRSVPSTAWATPPNCSGSLEGVIRMSSVRYPPWNAFEPFWYTVTKIDAHGMRTAPKAAMIAEVATLSIATLRP